MPGHNGGRHRELTDKQIERMKYLRREGFNTKQIGRIMGVSYSTVGRFTKGTKYDFRYEAGGKVKQ